MFICNIPSCANSISKATFPVSMPCPACLKMLSAASSLNEDELALLQNLPYVIVYPHKKNIRRKTCRNAIFHIYLHRPLDCYDLKN